MKDLDLVAEGENRGKRNLPAASTTAADHVETSIVTRIEGPRRKGLENYETNRQVYNERLARADTLRKEVEIVAGNASGDYLTAVRGWKAQMTASTERLHETFQHRKQFRAKYRLQRPARHFEGWVRFVSITIIFIALEALLNMFMFSRGNEQGMLGGLLTAVIFSGVNVVASVLLGIWACGLNHTNYLRKFLGLISLLAWVVLALALNLTVAHFRDLIDAETDWGTAVLQAVPAMKQDPLALSSMDSWILLAIGTMISIFAFLKGWHAFDPFPGYSRIESDLKQAREDHSRHFEEAIEELTEKRDLAIEELRDADQQVRDGISQAIDALYGHSSLNFHLENFLDQCDKAVTHLLAVYRDANVAARTEDIPPSFALNHAFAAFRPTELKDDARRRNAEAEAERVTAAVEAAIREIFANFQIAVTEFRLPEEVQQGPQNPVNAPANVA
ncbi:hypothetical protein [Chachezhania sediminis]|uniref:hypothetical protein n=1 Tax=Chachezhania sediminis TaxID=2599291 RepID=UPI00131C31A6|nr:hypothetical protein [Chachezhania sediminis]